MVIQFSDDSLSSAQITRNKNELSLQKLNEIRVQSNEEVVEFEQGVLYIKNEKNDVRRILVGEKNIESYNKLRNREKEHSDIHLKESVSEEDVLKMQIDPKMVMIADIQRYEKLMYGKAIAAESNSSLYFNPVNNVNHKGTLLYSKHHWNNTSQSKNLGPLELKFAYPTSLISLNIDLYFTSNNTQCLIDGSEEVRDITTQEQKEEQIQTTLDQGTSSSYLNKLGMLSIQQLSEDIIPLSQSDHSKLEVKDQNKQKQGVSNTNLPFLPLEVYYHKGAAYSQNYSVCKVVTDNNNMFASNYPRPEFYFKHQHGQLMLIEKVTIRSQVNSKCGAQPIGAGLIFLSETIEAFQNSTPFYKFTKADYTEWKQNRLKKQTPVMPYEPAGYFEFENQDLSLTIDIDFKRLAKYIFLKPTAFRKIQQGANQNFNNVPLEIEFFGASGTTIEDSTSLNENLNESLAIRGLQSDYSLSINQLGDSQNKLKVIENVEVQEVQGSRVNLSPSTFKAVFGGENENQSAFQVLGKTSLKITDSQLQLQLLKGLSINIESNQSQNWELKGVTVQAIVQDDSSQSTQLNSQPLFNNTQIPLSYLRSCLLSPKYFSVINKVLTQILSLNSSDNQIRQYILKFLNKIMKRNSDFIPLVMDEIDIGEFLKNNLFINDPSGFGQVFDFLQNFQRNAKFCNELYQILVNEISKIPENGISNQGYDAFMGMLKWATPINPEKTLEVILQTLFSNICLTKLSPLQTQEYIQFRTRTSLNSYPFDNQVFRAPRLLEYSSQQSLQSKEQRPENISEFYNFQNKLLPLKEMIRVKDEFIHSYSVKFEMPMIVTDIKLYLGQLDPTQYKLLIKVFSEDQLLFFQTYDENTFAYYAAMSYAKANANPQSDPSNDALHISHLDLQSSFLKVVIEFGISNSSLPKVNSKIKPPETIIELYGTPVDPNIPQQTLKEMLDKKAQEYWQEKAKIFKVGRSMQYLQVFKDPSESKLVPQGQQIQQQQLTEEKKPNNQEEQKQQQQQIDEQNQVQSNISSKNQELELLQDELKGKIRANDPNIKEIVDKIQIVQLSLFNMNNNNNNKSLVDSLEFYLSLASDYTKLVRRIVKTQNISLEKLNKILRQILVQNGMENFSMICFELFKRFIAYEQGSIRQEVLTFIDEMIYPIMNYDEKKTFSFKVIEEFLSQPISFISQKSVLEALNTLGIPEGELISFMLNKLNISSIAQNQMQGVSEGQSSVNPFIFMSSIFILSLNQLQKIQIPEPGKAMHIGISCSGCSAKMIVGWRYKCGSCSGDYNFDADCADKHIHANPEHVMIIIQEPLPYDSKIKPPKALKPVLPKFEFKQEVQQEGAQVIHEFFNCENCGKKPIIGNCFRCVNCEDYSLCEDCYKQTLYDHFSYHIFYKLHKPLKESEKNPTSLLQVLDPCLYSSIYTVPLDKKKNVFEEEEQQQEIGGDFEDLAPLSMSRSLSVPMNAQQKVQPVKGSIYEKLTIEQQFVVLFNTCVWICQDTLKSFQRQEKVILLKLTIETMLQLIKLTGVEKIYEVVSNKENFFNLLVSILQLNSKELIHLYKNLLDQMRQPPSLSRSLKEIHTEKDKVKRAAKVSDKKQMLSNQLKMVRQLLESMLVNIQAFLKWVVDIGLNPDLAKLQIPKGQEPVLLFNSYTQSQQIWLDHLSFLVEMFIRTNDELKDQQNKQGSLIESGNVVGGKSSTLEKIPEEEIVEGGLDKEEDLVPLSMGRSVSVPLNRERQVQYQQASSVSLQLIKSLIQLLHINDSVSQGGISSGGVSTYQSPQKSNNQQKASTSNFKQQESCTKYLSLMWSLVLKSLTTVSINQLIEAKIFDSLVSAFLISTEEIQQITFPQILNISESIAKNSTHSNDISKFISNLLFTTLENVTNTHHERVGYSICQGWIDILISSTIARSVETEKKNYVYAKMNAEEISSFLKRTSNYLLQHLNRGSFEGVTGCVPDIVLRLNLAQELVYIVRHTESKTRSGALAISELFQSCGQQQRLKKELQESMDYLITWLFLNARMACDEQAMSQLGNSCNNTPATTSVKKMTELIEEILLLVSNTDMNEVAIKIALSTLTSVARKMNKSILELAQSHSMGFDTSIKLSNRTNEYFIKFLKQWLISDSVASYFVFDLQGFEFLLDTIGLGVENKEQLEFEIIETNEQQMHQLVSSSLQQQQQQETQKAPSMITLLGSDLHQYLENIISEGQGSNQPQKEVKKDPAQVQQQQLIQTFESSNPPMVQEFSKTLCMVNNNGNDPIAQHQKTDWAVNKRGYKHRIIIKYLTGSLKNEYWILFSLPNPVELKEIQIGFNNYWGADTEIYAEPLSVLVEAGMDENNLSLVCNLQVVKDDAFGSVSATVFGKNLHSFPQSSQQSEVVGMQQLEEVIQQKLQSLQNFKVQYIKFCMRRFALTCLENSPLAIKFTKQVAFGINYISLLGFNLTQIGDYIGYIKSEQKKTALEVLSIICSGDFASILKVIANQSQTIEKMKKSFNQLAQLVSIKKNLIEPTFIAISAYNNDMGDWIINQFLNNSNITQHASLVGEIVRCNKQELSRRLLILQEHVMKELSYIYRSERATHGTLIKKLVPMIQIYIQTLRISAPELGHNKIDLNVNEEQMTWIVSLLSSATQEREQQTKVLTQLLVLLLCPPHPFTNKQVDVYDFTMKNLLVQEEAGINNEQVVQKEFMASIFSATQKKLALEILNREIKLDQILNFGKIPPQKNSLYSNNYYYQYINIDSLKFWYNVASDSQVKKELVKRKLPIQLYKNLREENPTQNNKIIKFDSSIIEDSELTLIIELIKHIIAGSKDLENELAELLKLDLDHLSNIRDMNFVNKVFLSLLKEEQTVPVCIWPYDSDMKRWIPHYRPLVVKDTSNTQQQSSNNNFLPSTLLQGESRSVLIKNFKDIVGTHAKGTLKKLTTSSWSLAHQQTEQGTVAQFAGVWKNIENKAPVIILVSTSTNGGGSNSIFGCYCAKGIPQVPANLAQDSDYTVATSPEDFLFCYVDDNSFYHFKPKAGVNILSMFTDYEGGGAISIANDFILVSFSYDFVFTVGVQYEIEKIQEKMNPVPSKTIPESNQSFNKLEIWTLGPQIQQVAVAASQKKVKFADQAHSSESDILQADFKHPWFNENSPFKNYRANPVFNVPAHLSLADLSKILLHSNVSFKPRFNPALTSQKEILSDLYQKFIDEEPLAEIFNSIIDLEYETNQLINVESEQQVKEKEEESKDEASGQISGYVPKMGLFESFEAQDGVKKIISVTLSSLNMWKQEQQAKSWSLWLKELESFSQLPLFFQIFLKNTKCKDLLFKVLAGQPDSEISAEQGKVEVKTKWEEEQKDAVQFNYKIVSEVFSISNDIKLRNIAVSCGLLPRILERLGSISGEKARTYDETEQEVVQEIQKPSSQSPLKEVKNTEKKFRKGVGYSKNVGEIFNVAVYLENKKLRNDQIKNLIDICTNFLTSKEWKANEEVLEVILESPLLPLLEAAFRNGSWLEMAKEKLTRAIVSQKKLVPCLLEIDKRYKPAQTEPIYKLLSKLNDLAEIFINCLSQQEKSEQEKNTNNNNNQTHKKLLTFNVNQMIIDEILEENLPALPIPDYNLHYSQEEVKKEKNASSVKSLITISDEKSSNSLLTDKEMKSNKFIGMDPFATLIQAQALPKSVLSYQKPIQENINQDEEVEEKKESFSDQIFSAFMKDEESQKKSLMQMIQDSIIKSQIKKQGMVQSIEEKKNLGNILKKIDSDSSQEDEIESLQDVKSEDKYQKDPNDLILDIEKDQDDEDDVEDDDEEESDESWESEGGTKYDIQKVKGGQKLVKKENQNKEEEDDDEDSQYKTVSEEEYDEEELPKSKLKHKKQKQTKKSSKVAKKILSKQLSSEEDSNSLAEPSQNSSSPSSSSSSVQQQKDIQKPYYVEPPNKKIAEVNKLMKKLKSNSSSGSEKYYDDEEDEEEEEEDEENSQYKESSSDSSSEDEEEENQEAEGPGSSSDSYDTESEETINSNFNQTDYQEQDSEIPEKLAKDVIKTYRVVMNAVEKLRKHQEDENFLENALSLPVEQSYRILLQDLRFAYMDMKDPNDLTGQHFKHHYQSIAAQNQNPPPSKMVRLAQELADLSNALPSDHTNAIYVRVDQSRVDMMKALVCGASNTPYAHGCYEFDIFCDNNYPREPPKMNLITTGNGQVRFNPNLYACGKVCLSLLGTWRGQATENWDPKLSTILQVLLSTQAIIMSEEVYFNEPGFENEAGTPEGEKKNEGYQNIVRYCNIKFAMIDQLKKPSRGFETVIKRHFYLKKEEIMTEVNHWLALTDKHEATYAGLVNDHNYNWANQFKTAKTKYKEMLQAAIKQLEEELNKLERPNDQDLKLQQKSKKRVQQKKPKNQDIKQGGADLEEISVGTDDEEEQINTESKEMDIKDEKVQDRWSRYIGAMGAEAVAKQAAAKIFLSGAGALGIEIAKNIVLAGCRQFTLHDCKPISYKDLSGQFFLNLEEDILNQQKKKATRGEACLPRLRQLNYYVKCTLAEPVPIPLKEEDIIKEPWNFMEQDVIILTEATNEEIIFANNFCRKYKKKFICADSYGPFGRIFNDFGDKFEVLDKNGEDLQDVMIKSITNEEKGIVELLPSNKHKFEDGDEVLLTKVEGMELLPGQKHEDESVQSSSINETIHKVQVITPYSFKIGDTTKYEKYKINGIAKQLKTKKVMSFKTYEETMMKGNEEFPLDCNLGIADFEKMRNNILSHIAFEALDLFRSKEKKYPGVWNIEDANKFIELCKEIGKRYDLKAEEINAVDSYELKFFYLFSFSCQGVLNPLCAYLGGFVAQECIKAITQKFSPIGQVFYYDAFEILPDFDPKVHIKGENNNEETFFENKYVKEMVKTREQSSRYDGLRIVVGSDIVEQLAYTRLFMVGAGAIGCELLKNYAMIGVGVGKQNQQYKKKGSGQIVLTDPDVIEVSNLNRQFLFREKHLRKPKSQTAATAAIYMNSELKENIVARLDKVHEGTNNIFTDQFFEQLTVVTNALDNVQARRYIDARCVTAKTPLLESGTLGPKGHVQVVLPYKTESYGSMNDPEDNTEIPHCTLKMFPEETLHCVEWARDKFGKLFSQGPKNTLKILEEGSNFQPVSQQDIMSLRECVRILQKRPKTFDQCVEYARLKFEKYFNHDIRQLLHVYPLDAKTKDGNPFWALPKRPPTHIQFDKDNILHCFFVSSFACLRATVFKVAIPSDKPRSEDFRRQVGVLASKIQVPDFVPNDEKAKEIQASVNKAATGKEEEKKEEEKQEEDQKIDPNDTEKLMTALKGLSKDIQQSGIKNYSKQFISPEEFEKDNDANYHIDIIYAMANCRSSNYQLDPMDWITVKLKAGRIVPALATTTASIAGLQTLELIKLIKQCKKTDHRNIFLNLAVPMMQASEPGDVMKTKLVEGLEVTLWDRWEVKLGKDVKLFQVMGFVEQQFKGLLVKDVMRGNTPIYFHAIMSGQGKEKERDKLLNSQIMELVGADSDDKYVDLNVTCTKKGDQEEKILSGVPPVRVYFE